MLEHEESVGTVHAKKRWTQTAGEKPSPTYVLTATSQAQTVAAITHGAESWQLRRGTRKGINRNSNKTCVQGASPG